VDRTRLSRFSQLFMPSSPWLILILKDMTFMEFWDIPGMGIWI